MINDIQEELDWLYTPELLQMWSTEHQLHKAHIYTHLDSLLHLGGVVVVVVYVIVLFLLLMESLG